MQRRAPSRGPRRSLADAARRTRWQLAVPAALTGALAVRAGGFFPDTVGVLAVVLLALFVGLVTLRSRPLTGWSPALAVSASALCLLAVWTLLSGTWSHAPFRALSEFDRVLAYALMLGLSGFFATRRHDLDRVLRLVAAVVFAVAAAALATRLYPATFPVQLGRDPSRLAFPLTYWNALAVLCAVGCVLVVHCSAGAGSRPLLRVLAAGALPVVAVTLYFTFSRGGIAVAAAGVVAYGLLARPRRLPVVLAAAGVPTAIAVAVAYGAGALATSEYARAAGDAHRVAAVVLACTFAAMALRALALPADRWIDGLSVGRRQRRAALAAALVVALGLLLVTAATTDLANRLTRGESANSPSRQSTDRRTRLSNIGSPSRRDHWRVALRAFEREPVLGTGAGTYVLEWQRERDISLNVTDAHSLYLETMGELGVPGLLLLAIALAVPLGVAARRLRGGERHAHAAFLAAGLALLAHAAVDWDWEMPAVFAWYFAASGVVCAARAGGGGGRDPARLARVVAGLACLLLAATPVSVALSQGRLERAGRAFRAGDCTQATAAALDSLHTLSARPEPFELLGYCDLRAGQRRLALDAMRAAGRRDPGNWQYAYGLAVARALDGQDPRADSARALRLNPRSGLARDLFEALRGGGPRRWARAAAKAQIPRE
jgi:O-antigen ligase